MYPADRDDRDGNAFFYFSYKQGPLRASGLLGRCPEHWPGAARVQPEPLGSVLIIGPWNYPISRGSKGRLPGC